MGIITKNRLKADLQSACRDIKRTPVVVHSDLLRIGSTQGTFDREAICKDYEEVLNEVFGDRPLFIPTFNYDFCKTGIYDRIQTPSQVGALSDYCRTHYAERRTKTPIFHFVILNGSYPLTADTELFGKTSLFARLHKEDALMLFLGADFAATTFLHYIEECMSIGYRYLKPFSGLVVDGDTREPITVWYRVRPRPLASNAYDWPKLLADAKTQHVLHEHPVGNGTVLYYNAGELFDFWTKKMKQDELYLLTPSMQREIRTLYENKGYPLTLDMFEC